MNPSPPTPAIISVKNNFLIYDFFLRDSTKVNLATGSSPNLSGTLAVTLTGDSTLSFDSMAAATNLEISWP
jgi:hypothetical protein